MSAAHGVDGGERIEVVVHLTGGDAAQIRSPGGRALRSLEPRPRSFEREIAKHARTAELLRSVELLES